MKKILNKMIIFVLIYLIFFIVLYEILRCFSLHFRQWFYILSAILIILGFSIGVYYKIFIKKSKRKKIILSILYTIVLIVLLINPYTLIFVLFSYQPEHVVEKNNQKMVAYVSAFLDTTVYYYKYINPFVIGNKVMEEYYGKGGFDPIKNNNSKIVSTTYFDENGNEIKTEYNSREEENTQNNMDSNIQKVEKPKKEENYYIENGKCYTNITGEKKEILTPTEAADIADEEGKNPKYQYQPWKSEFLTRGKNKDDSISIELIIGLDDISKFYHWTEEWKKASYENRLMWKIRMFDENDPLTSLYIYIDSITGEIIGAGQSSD